MRVCSTVLPLTISSSERTPLDVSVSFAIALDIFQARRIPEFSQKLVIGILGLKLQVTRRDRSELLILLELA